MADATHRGRRLNVETSAAIERLETDLLMEALSRAYGLDMRRYARPAFEAWATSAAQAAGAENVSALIERMLHDREFGSAALGSLYYSDVQLFDNPSYWQAVRTSVLPWLRTSPFISIWMPDCGHGAGVYSLAILLEDAGLYERTRIYATDSDSGHIARAAQGIVAQAVLNSAHRTYQQIGGIRALDSFFVAEGPNARLHPRLWANIVWSQFDLAQGESFNEFHFIDGRLLPNTKQVPRNTLKVLTSSMPVSGLLALNPEQSAELLRFSRNYKEWGHGLHQRIA
ncbi:MAG TPA: CheR family methyltransferase [Burkholderiales bacterium]|nr:CheR family methyltransferase [Burkholderiales bacterium]